MKITVLVGVPGSGKSTYAAAQGSDYVVINQDTLGNADKCIEAAHEALKAGKSIIIDRCNQNEFQRKRWVKLALYYAIDIDCVYFNISKELAIERLKTRENHPTIAKDMPLQKKISIVNSFYKELKEPQFNEGFKGILTYHVDNLQSASKNDKGNDN